jgi:DNA-binding PadR family transcriptional regulator
LRDQSFQFLRALGYSDTVVYAALDGLERRGLLRIIERDEPRTRRGSQRIYYEVLEEGRSHFDAWMASTLDKAPLREGLHMQLMEAEDDDLPHMVDGLVHFEEQCREQLRELMEHPLRSSAARAGAPGVALVQDGLVTHLQAMIEWAQRSRRALLNRLDDATGVPGRRRP